MKLRLRYGELATVLPSGMESGVTVRMVLDEVKVVVVVVKIGRLCEGWL